MNIITIIQARMGSDRLPGKVLLPLGNSCVLDYVVRRCIKSSCDKVIVATTTKVGDDPIVDWCNDNQINVFRGSEDDVLSRFIDCSTLEKADYIVRVTADCPFVDFDQIDKIINIAAKTASDMVVYEEGQPRGFASELISYNALQTCHLNGKEVRHREHVTFYCYEHAEDFKITRLELPSSLNSPNLRLTIDTPEDYLLCKKVSNIFENIYISTSEIVKYLNEHPEIACINSHIQQKPVI